MISSLLPRLGLVLALGLTVSAASAREVRVAVLAFQGSERASQDFAPTIAALNAALPEHSFTMVPLDLAGVASAVEEHSVDFVITNPGDYVVLEARSGVTRLATIESRDHAVPTDTVGSTVIVRGGVDHPTDFDDLRGAHLAVVSRGAFGGWQVIWREMFEAGVDPDALSEIVETGYPMEGVIEALREGRADAGVLRACMLENHIAQGLIAPDEFAVVAERPEPGFPCRVSSRLYPDWPFARLASTETDLAKAVTAALLQMPPSDGRAWTAPQDYTTVHALFRDLRIGPYAYLARTSVLGYVRAHWHWFALASVASLWWVIHVAHVETLVRRRTAELTREVAEREKAERRAQMHREERDQFSRLGILGEMASSIAHELNQPLAAIANYAEGMTRAIDRGKPDTAFLRDGARGIAGQAERAGAIIRRIRAFMRRRAAHRERLDLNVVLREALEFFHATAARKNIPLTLNLEANLPRVVADRIEIEQVLLNLMQNAVDAMAHSLAPAHGIVLSTSSGDGAVTVAVRDHGTGLSAEAEAHLFDAFYTTKAQGLGLGLPICRTIIEAHGGRLSATTEPDGGLTMRFTLPAAPEEQS